MTNQTRIDQNRRLLGISNTYLKGQPPLSHAKEAIEELLAEVEPIVLLPYALADMDKYAEILKEAFLFVGITQVVSLHTEAGREEEVLNEAGAVFIGGGNTSRLVANLHSLRHQDGSPVDPRPAAAQKPLVDILRRRVAEGMPLLGASAGTNVMCGDIRTTNDMHVAVQRQGDGQIVSRLDALGLLPAHLSINPHYLDKVELTEEERTSLSQNSRQKILTLLDHQGEARRERLERVLSMDPHRRILALREGAYIRVEGMGMELGGVTGGLLFESEQPVRSVEPGEDLSFLLAEAG